MFSQAQPGLCLFNKAGSNVLLDAFTESAKTVKSSGKQLIFTHIDVFILFTWKPNSEHLGPFADYIKTDPSTMAIVLIEGKIKSKFVLVKNPADVTAEDITAFVESWSNGDAKKYGMTDEVKVEAAAAEGEELWFKAKFNLTNFINWKISYKWVSTQLTLLPNTAQLKKSSKSKDLLICSIEIWEEPSTQDVSY